MADLVIVPLKIRHIPLSCIHEIIDAELFAGVATDEHGNLHVHEICHSALLGPIDDDTHGFLLPTQGILPAGSMKGLKAICLRSFLRFSSANA